MNFRTLIAALGGAVVNFFLGWLVYGLLLMDYYEANTVQYEGLMNEMPNLFMIFLGGLSMALLYTIIYQVWAGIKTFLGGLKAGIIIGFLFSLSINLYWQASMNLMTNQVAILDVFIGAAMLGLMGGVIGWILGIGKKPEMAG